MKNAIQKEVETYYSRGGVTVQRATVNDANYVAFNMRKQDVQEIWDAAHMTPSQAMTYSINNTIFCLSIRIKGVPCAIFGVNGVTVLGHTGVVWLLGSDDVKKIGYRFVRHSRYFVKVMLGFYPIIFNHVSIENTVSIAWLKNLGAKFEVARPYGVEGKLFRRFSFERNISCV